jgi:hypothetical protein
VIIGRRLRVRTAPPSSRRSDRGSDSGGLGVGIFRVKMGPARAAGNLPEAIDAPAPSQRNRTDACTLGPRAACRARVCYRYLGS